MRQTVQIAFVAAMLVLRVASVAVAGGSVWHFDRYYQPGEHVESSTTAAWGHNPNLGTPEDGPYFVYMATDENLSSWPGIQPDWMLVGVVDVSRLGTPNASSATATARFEIPDVAAGEYHIFHCNDPCTTTLGDVVGGWGLRVVAGDAGRPPQLIATEIAEQWDLALPGLVADQPPPPEPGLKAVWMIAASVVGIYVVIDLFRAAWGWHPQ